MLSEANPSDPETEATPIIEGLASLAGDYDGFIVDLLGTIHNGVEPLPGARWNASSV